MFLDDIGSNVKKALEMGMQTIKVRWHGDQGGPGSDVISMGGARK